MTPVSVFADKHDEEFAAYDVELSFHDKLLGGSPKKPDLIEAWIRKSAGVTDEMERRRIVVQTLKDQGVELPAGIDVSGDISDVTYEEVIRASEAIAGEQNTCGFKKNGHGIYVESRHVKAMIREAVNIGFAGERWGRTRKGPKAFTAERVMVGPDQILLGDEEPHGVHRTIKHIEDRQGKRSALGYYEYVEQPVISFQVEVLDDDIAHENWPRIWVIAEMEGLGACRSQGYGTFSVTKWERVR